MAKAQALLHNVTNFNLKITPLLTRNTFAYAHSIRELLQAKSNDVVKGYYIIGPFIDLFRNVSHALDDYHEKCYRETSGILVKLNIDNVLPRVCPR